MPIRSVSVIIPVFNAFDDTLRCLESVLRHTPSQDVNRVYVIDDASTAGILAEFLPEAIKSDPRFTFSRNVKNLGFVATCNLGMSLASSDDVVLLNSDTEVTKNWLSKLARAAYARPDIGTVSSLTNKGVICSVPRFCLENEIPTGYTIDSFGELVEKVSVREYPELVTCVGHCVYIRRTAIDAIGTFDVEAFGKGYGEENDFSCRLRKVGMVDILDDATFIYHRSKQSFGQDQQGGSKENLEVLKRRYPHYLDDVSLFCRQNPLSDVHSRILDEMVARWSKTKAYSVLHIVQDGPRVDRRGPRGGTEFHVTDLIDNVREAAHWSLVPGAACYYLTAHLPDFDREYIVDLSQTTLKKLLDPEHFNLVHLHHERWMDHHELCQALLSHGNYIVSLHDYIMVCPRFHLYTPFRKVCNGHECSASCSYTDEYISQYRSDTSAVLSKARQVICFSESTRDWIRKILRAEFSWKILGHGIIDFAESKAESKANLDVKKPSGNDPLRIAFLGHIPQHKGSLLIEKLIEHKQVAGGVAVEWHVIGKLFLEVGNKVIDHGSYNRGELFEKLRALNPHIVAILSICPETYSLTLDEAWNSGVPVLSTPFGAPAERVGRSGAGWVLPELSEEAFMRAVDQILDDWPGYLRARAATEQTPLRSVGAEAAEYSATYKAFKGNVVAADAQALLWYLKPFILKRAPEFSKLKLALKRVVNKVIWIADSLRLRRYVERAAYWVIPRRYLEHLKAIR